MLLLHGALFHLCPHGVVAVEQALLQPVRSLPLPPLNFCLGNMRSNQPITGLDLDFALR